MSKIITLDDKNFKPYIDQKRIATEVQRIAEQINKDLKKEFPVFLAVLNGSFMFASDLLKEITIPCELAFVKVASYQGTQSMGKLNDLIGLNCEVENRTVVILEDIVDTGLTIEKLVENLKRAKAKEIKVATVLFKPSAYKKDITINYVGFEIPNEFVVGYGLDYNGLGRNLKEIHVIV